MVENVGFEPRLRIPNAVCSHYTTFSILNWQPGELNLSRLQPLEETPYLVFDLDIPIN